jgi:hypothetical protein
MEEKIAKLLAMAEGTTNPHEAEIFMAQAEKLMLKYGIDRAMLDGKAGSKREEIVVEKISIPNGHGYAVAMVQVGHAVGPSFNLKTLQSNLYDGGKVLWLIGHSSDVRAAEQLVSSLLAQSRSQALHWWKTEGKQSYFSPNDNDAYLARREFIFAFASGVRARLKETRNRVVEEAGTGTELVLVDRASRVESWVDENMKVGKGRASHRNHGGYAAARAGEAAGRDAVTTKKVAR